MKLGIGEGLKLRFQSIYDLDDGSHTFQLPLVLTAKNPFYDFAYHIFSETPPRYVVFIEPKLERALPTNPSLSIFAR